MMEEIIRLMNLAENRYNNAQLKEDFVIRSMLELNPQMTVEEVKDIIGLMIGFSKLSTKVLFNLTENNCNGCNIL
jgi:hypothetical protein